jgi:hypothetical protein
MIEMKMNLRQAKGAFFTADWVKRRLGPVVARVLSSFGAGVMKRAQWSIRSAKGSAKEGEPPHSHSGLLRDFLFFAFDPETETVVIGPARLGGRGAAQTPGILERGGPSVRIMGWKTIKGQRRLVPVNKPVRIKKHPYMAPAFAVMEKQLPELWARAGAA